MRPRAQPHPERKFILPKKIRKVTCKTAWPGGRGA